MLLLFNVIRKIVLIFTYVNYVIFNVLSSLPSAINQPPKLKNIFFNFGGCSIVASFAELSSLNIL